MAAALLALPSAALADGTYELGSDAAHVTAHAKTTDGKGAYFFVLHFTVAVSDGSTSGGASCQHNFQGDPKAVECPVARSPTGALSSTLDAMFVLASSLPCGDAIGLESSIDGQTYRDDGKLTFTGTCGPSEPPQPPTPEPTSTPAPDQGAAGGAVSKPHNPIVTGAGAGGGPHVRLFEPPGMTSFSDFFAYTPAFTGGVRVALGDVNGDGQMDVITATGPGGGPNVKVFDGKTGNLLQSFFAFDPSFSGGVFVAAGDVNGDGHADIAVAPDAGGGPNVKVFSGADLSVLRSFFAFDPGFSGGVRVATGDVNGDGKVDLITGAGPGGGPQVKVWGGTDGSVLRSFLAEPPAFTGGVFVAAGDVNGDGFADIVVGPDSGGGPTVKVFNGKTSASLAAFVAYTPAFTGGVRVGTGDVNGDGTPDVITGTGPGGGPHVKVFDGTNSTQINSFFAFDPGFTGGVYVGGATEPSGAGVGGSTFPLIGGGITLDPSCPIGVPGGFCSGKITLLLPAVQKRVGQSAAKSKAKKPVVLGSAKFKVAAGKRVKVHVALSKRALKALGRARKVKAFAQVVTRDAAGNASTRQTTIVLTRH